MVTSQPQSAAHDKNQKRDLLELMPAYLAAAGFDRTP
jgi:hypothetical protein